jgi:pyruvate formate lyase activating enzyme
MRERPAEALPLAARAHAGARREFGLPETVPRTEGGLLCRLCGNGCRLGDGERGFCGLRVNEDGRLRYLAGSPERGLLHWYRDPLPTNCVADWVCQGHHQRGCHNLAVFYCSCTADCLFCQNWHYRQVDATISQEEQPPADRFLSGQELAAAANPRTYCVCYFGGDPASQMAHALATSRKLAERGVAICWETNGNSHPGLLDQAVDLSLRTGGCIKFDLKALDKNLYVALAGISNERLLENFARVARRAAARPQPPLVVASTLLVPGYVDSQEVGRIARFIAGIDPTIPYSLLGFGPGFFMSDLPRTSVRHAQEAERAARDAGLTRVHVGNRHLLSRDYQSKA